MNRSPLGRDGREAPVRVLQLGIDMSKTACIQTATQCPLLSFDSLLRSTPLPSLPRCARASLEARPRSASCVTAQREREAERASVSIVCNGLPRLFLLVCFACPHLPRSVCAALDRRPRLFCRLRYSRKRERWDAAGRDFDGVDRSLRYDRHGKGRGFSCACGARL